MRRLKKIRVFISVLFFVLTGFLFLDITGFLPAGIHKIILFPQFVPSLLQFISVFSIASAGFILIIVITLLFGRVYCGSICPLGTLHDFISHRYKNKKKRKRKKYSYKKELKITRYSILFLVVVSVLVGIFFPLILLDPYSNFGRIFSQLFRPILIAGNNSAAFALEKIGIYLLYPIEIKQGINFLLLFPLFFLGILFILALKRGRLYCNTICPVGTLLGVFSKFSFFKLIINEESCTECGLCEKVCKSECIDNKNKKIDFDRCVACFNCVTVCRSNSISYKRKNSYKKEKKVEVSEDFSKREFLVKTGIYFFTFTGINFAQVKILPKKESKIPVYKKFPVIPPGAKKLKHYNNRCTACHLCVSACPSKVLQPSYLEFGFTGMLQPFMDFKASFCNFECTICGDICPSGAIQPIKINNKKVTQLGKAVFEKRNCVVETEKTACGACSEHCPTKAVMMVDYKGNLKIPKVDDKYCIGCGACEFACPVKPYKAIYVEGNPVHLLAEKKKEEKLDQEIDLKEDFPF